jgi:hypothetical protein
MKAKKQSVDIALVLNKERSELLNLVMHDQEYDHYVDFERSVEKESFFFLLNNHKKEECKCGKNIPSIIFFKFISPVLNQLLESAGFKFKLTKLRNVIVKQRSSPSSTTYFREDVKAMRIEWEWKEIYDEEHLDAEVRRWTLPYHYVSSPELVYRRNLTMTASDKDQQEEVYVGVEAKMDERKAIQSDIECWMQRNGKNARSKQDRAVLK